MAARAPWNGVKIGTRKLTAADVRAIRAAADAGEIVSVIARRYPTVHRNTIDAVVNGRTWNWVDWGES